jgi:thioredoxin reductase (NADPH)
MEKVVIIGSGPAGLTCSIYAARSGLSPIVIAGDDPGGQLTRTSVVENFPGFTSIDGASLMMKMIEQAEKCGTKIIFEKAKKIKKVKEKMFSITLSEESKILAQSVVITTGAYHKKLNIPGELEFSSKGVSWCATCDAPMYRNKKVAVIGGGNSALMEAAFLTQFADVVFLIHRRDVFRADHVMTRRVLDNPKIKVIWDSVVTQILGDSRVNEIVIEDTKNQNSTSLSVDGVFIAIGTRPMTELVNCFVDLDNEGYIIPNNGTLTSCNGVFAAGDVVSGSLKQAVYAAGTGALAAYQVEEFLGIR